MSTTDVDSSSGPKWKLVGPGLVVAATGVGAADLVATLIAGQKYGYALLWTVVIGCLMKVVLVEGAGRYSLATGKTIYEGWSTLGVWTHIYFVPYIVIWGFVYGGAALAGTGLPLNALFPFIDVKVGGILCGLIGLALVWVGKYGLFEKICAALGGLMFVTMVAAAIRTVPNLPELAKGLAPTIPDGGMVNVLSVAGGVGGTITLAAYGYWIREKGWVNEKSMRVMRLDNRVAYIVTGLFVAATLIVGAELLYSGGVAVKTSDEGLLDLGNILEDRYGVWFGKLFLIGFFSAAMSSLLGVWNGVSLMFADLVGHLTKLPSDDPDRLGGGKWYKAYILWLTFPPILLIMFGEPVWLILAYGVLGAVFMPFLAVTLLWILNTDRVPRQWRNKWWSNTAMVACAVLFLWLAVIQIDKAIG
ncbi:Nramp family divalent metal transporter [Demetria terragena]|uniref:Nramp family divalent metal transporter n=1 Tax=Demetria terragena TaxID=63959 RepID=UPI000476FEA0|nr:Nramp family divalent metal transporter [Demetria terragena]